ncbi:MAG: hypothetical protein WCC04_02010 [Terriglobales bacterium]
MLKLSGWKRAGIIASVVWILGAGFTTLVVANNRTMAFHRVLVEQCMAPPNDWGDTYRACLKDADDYSMKMLPSQRTEAALVAFVPVPFGWGFSYLVLFLVRWVKRGFVA